MEGKRKAGTRKGRIGTTQCKEVDRIIIKVVGCWKGPFSNHGIEDGLYEIQSSWKRASFSWHVSSG